MNKKVIFTGVSFLAFFAIIFGFYFLKINKTEVSKNDKKVEVFLVCSNGYKADAMYYAPNERGVLTKLKLKIEKNGFEDFYEMQPVISGSGAKFADAKNNFSFWEHQDEFTFASNEETIAICHRPVDFGFTVDEQEVFLKNGIEEKEIFPNSATKKITRYFGNEARGDFNGDGLEDIAFVITQSTGGTGFFYYIVVALQTESGYRGTNAVLLGDRISPQTTQFSNNEIIVNYADRNSEESFANSPTVGVSKYLKVVDKQLVEVKK